MPDYKLSFSAAGETHKGAGHKNNEDNFLIGSHYKKNAVPTMIPFVLQPPINAGTACLQYSMEWVAVHTGNVHRCMRQKNSITYI
mgnify:CR=1 FL=1